MSISMEEYLNQYKVEELLRQLIALDTQNPPGNELKVIEFILTYLKLPISCYEILYHGNNRATLIIKFEGRCKSNGIAFLGHLDTVPHGDLAAWEDSPFSGTIRKGRMFGLGASDMKSGVASLLIMVRFLMEHKTYFKNPVYFIFTADEETGSIGATQLRKLDKLKEVKEVIVTEPTDCDMVIGEKGVMWVELVARGKSAHAAMPAEGINANEMLISCIDLLASEIHNLPKSKLFGEVTMSTTQFHGGFKCNIIPDYAKATIDIRTVRKSNHKDILKSLKLVADEMKKSGAVIEYKVLINKIPLETKTDTPMVQKFLQIMKTDVTNCKTIPYYTDLAEIMKYDKKDFVIIGPGERNQMHKPNESVCIENVGKVAKILLDYIMETIK